MGGAYKTILRVDDDSLVSSFVVSLSGSRVGQLPENIANTAQRPLNTNLLWLLKVILLPLRLNLTDLYTSKFVPH